MGVKVRDKCETLITMWRRDCEGTGIEESGSLRRLERTIKNLASSLPAA